MILRTQGQGQDTSGHVFKMFLKHTEFNKWSSNDLLLVDKKFLPVVVFPFSLFYRVNFVIALYPFDTRIESIRS